MCHSVCKHAVCTRCLESDHTGALNTCHQCRHEEPLWQGPQYLANVARLLLLGDDECEADGKHMLVSKLSTVGLTRFAVRNYAHALMRQYDAAGDSDGEPSLPGSVSDFVQSCESDDVRMWCLTVIRRRGGSSYLNGFLRSNGANIPWFQPKCAVATAETLKLPFDPFADKRDQRVYQVYAHAVFSLTPAVINGDYNMDEVKALKHGISAATVLPILFSAVHCSISQIPGIALPGKVARVFSSFDMTGCSSFASGLMNNFADLPPDLATVRALLVPDGDGGEAKLMSSLLRVQVLTNIVRLAVSMPRSWYVSHVAAAYASFPFRAYQDCIYEWCSSVVRRAWLDRNGVLTWHDGVLQVWRGSQWRSENSARVVHPINARG